MNADAHTFAEQATLFYIIFGVIAAVFMFIIFVSYIDATRCRINDFYKLSSLVHASIHALDMVSDILFTIHLSFNPKWKPDISSMLFNIFLLCLIFIIFPMIITLIQLNREINKHWISKNDDELRSWTAEHANMLYFISIILGSSFASVDLCCSNLFHLRAFSMPINRMRLISFQNKIYSLVLCENIPQLVLQIFYAEKYTTINTWKGEIVYIAMLFSFISIVTALFSWKSRKKILVSQNCVVIQFDVKGNVVCSNVTKCKNKVNKIRETVSGILGVDKYLIEIIKPRQIPNGLKITINVFVNYVKAVDTNWQEILLEADNSGQLGLVFKESWNLAISPAITNIQYKTKEAKGRKSIKIKVVKKKKRTELIMLNDIKPDYKFTAPLIAPIIKRDYGTNSETKGESDVDDSFDSTCIQNTATNQRGSMEQQENWDLLLDAVEQNCPIAEQYCIFKAMNKVAKRLLMDDVKYRRLHANNPKVKQKILGRVGGYEFLKALGFKHDAHNNQLICSEPNQKIINLAINALQRRITVLEVRRHEWDPQYKNSGNNNNFKKQIALSLMDDEKALKHAIALSKKTF